MAEMKVQLCKSLEVRWTFSRIQTRIVVDFSAVHVSCCDSYDDIAFAARHTGGRKYKECFFLCQFDAVLFFLLLKEYMLLYSVQEFQFPAVWFHPWLVSG